VRENGSDAPAPNHIVIPVKDRWAEFDRGGVYFEDPDGHRFELITRPYAGIPEKSARGVAVKYQH